MLRDYTIPRPRGADTYRVHQVVEQLTESHARPLWRADESTVVIRTEAPLAAEGRDLEPADPGLYLFELVAAVSRRDARRCAVYFPSSDRQARVDWLERQSTVHGFEIVSVRVSARKDVIRKGRAPFAIDETSFIGVLRVTDPARFERALREGIGRIGKAFGRGLLTVERMS